MTDLKKFIKYYWLALVSGILIFGINVFIYLDSKRRLYQREEIIFERRTEDVIERIENRMGDYIQVLRSTNAFITSSDTVTREEWNNFIRKLNLTKTYPGIQALAYTVIIPPSYLEEHIRTIQREGFPDYQVKPSGDRSVYTSIIYIYPFEGRNLRAFGYDMFSDSTRRKAMELARDLGQPVISGKVRLVQETDTEVQPGFLLYFPVYRNGSLPLTLEERRNSIRGYVYNPFRAYDLMNSIIGNDFQSLDIEIYDDSPSKKNLIYDKNAFMDFGKPLKKSEHSRLIHKRIAGRTWVIYFTSMPSFGSTTERTQALIIFIIGNLLGLMLFLVIIAVSKGKKSKAEADARVRKNAALLQKVFQEAPAFVGLVKASDQTFILANPHYRKLFGDRPLLDRPVREALEGLESQGFFEPLDEVIKTGKPFTVKEMRYADPQNDGDTKVRFFNINYQPLFNEQGRLENVLLFAVEVTEQITARYQLNEINQQLNQKNAELIRINNDLDNFIYTASHDLKAPISNIEGLAMALSEELEQRKDNEGSRDLLKMINQSIQRFKNTIQDLSDITKIQKNISEDLEDVDIAGVIAETTEDIKNLIEASKADIRIYCPGIQVRFSRINLKSVIYNLLSNAIKYRSPERALKIEIFCSEDSTYTMLEVTDNGLGINKHSKDKVFGMFKRAHTHVDGTGVGLYIVKRIIENYGGKVVLESEEGVGTTFRIYIPK